MASIFQLDECIVKILVHILDVSGDTCNDTSDLLILEALCKIYGSDNFFSTEMTEVLFLS